MLGDRTGDGPGDTPLLDALLAHAREKRISFHMPGHAAGAMFPAGPLASIGVLDTTELPGTDDINNPSKSALRAMRLAADAFGAERTFFLTSGSTTGILAMVAYVRSTGRTLLLPRTVHRSVLHAVAVTGIGYLFIPEDETAAEEPSFSPFRPLSVRAVDALLERMDEPCAVLVTSPDYYGLCADLPVLSATARKHDALLLVDEAHGAHYRFGGASMPVGAMEAGADLCVQSAHKTLPALTQAAMLHLSHPAVAHGRIDPAGIRRMIRLFQTSSPSFPVAASIDYARDWMVREGGPRIARWIYRLETFDSLLPDGLVSSASVRPDRTRPDRDPLRLVIDTSGSGIAAPDLLRALTASGMDVEMADTRRLVCILAFQSDLSILDRLADKLRDIVRLDNLPKTGTEEILRSDRRYAVAMAHPPEQALSPGDVLFPDSSAMASEWIPLRKAGGRIAAEALVPYPPGIPMAWPGERLDVQLLETAERLSRAGIDVDGLRAITLRDGSREWKVQVLRLGESTGGGADHV